MASFRSRPAERCPFSILRKVRQSRSSRCRAMNSSSMAAITRALRSCTMIPARRRAWCSIPGPGRSQASGSTDWDERKTRRSPWVIRDGFRVSRSPLIERSFSGTEDPSAWTRNVYYLAMTKLLEQAVETVRGLPPEVQDDLARMLLQLAGKDQPAFQLSAEEESALGESLAQADR